MARYSLFAAGFSVMVAITGPAERLSAQQADPVATALSPGAWDSSVRRYFEEFEAVGFQDVEKPVAEGRYGAVTATTGATGVYAGLAALQQGGTAADAAVATMLTQVVTAAGSYVSYAGMMNVMYYEADTGQVHSLNAGFNSVRAESDPLSIPLAESGRTALVPGFMKGAEALHARFGKLPWAALFEPAIYYAEQGFELPPLIALYMRGRAPVLERLPEARAIFTKPGGGIYAHGDLFRQPDLAVTLRNVAANGADYMYSGEWAERFVATVQREGGRIGMDDMRSYEVIWADPVSVTFGGMEIHGPGAPARGGTWLAEALNVASEADLIALGSYRDSAHSFYWLSQIMRLYSLEFWDAEIVSSMMPGIDMSLAARSTRAHAQMLWGAIQAGRLPIVQRPQLADHSDAVVAVDRWGNIAAATHTINTTAWGSSGIFVGGISISDAAVYQLREIAKYPPGSRALDTTQPLIIASAGQPVAAVSSIGSLHSVTLSVLMNLATSHPDLKGAIDAPLLHRIELEPHTMQVYANEFDSELLEEVRAMGANVAELAGIRAQGGISGYIVGIAIDPQSGMRRAVGSRRLSALPLAY